MSVGDERFLDSGDCYIVAKRVKRKPPHWMLELKTLLFEDLGVRSILQKGRKGTREWQVLLPGGGAHSFKTKREALEFFSRLRPLSQTDLVSDDVAIVDPTTHAEMAAAARAPFSHNDVDEDGAIIDIDVNGERMEYSSQTDLRPLSEGLESEDGK